MTDQPKIDPSKIRVGDEVDVRMKVTSASEPWCSLIFVRTSGADVPIGITPADIIAHHPRQLQVGDKVRDSTGEVWEITGGRRESAVSGPEYGLFNEAKGYGYEIASTVESWERVQ